jgi:hypothetical protein
MQPCVTPTGRSCSGGEALASCRPIDVASTAPRFPRGPIGSNGTILDAAVSANAAEDVVSIEVTLLADNLTDGTAHGLTAMRNAIHKVGGATPDWPSHQEVLEMVGKELRAELVRAA